MPKFTQVVAVVLVASGLGLAQTSSVPVFTQTVTTGMAGVALGQTARLNVLNLAASTSATTSTCSVELDFLDAQGKTLASSQVLLGTGEAKSLDFPAPSSLAAGGRDQIRGVVKYSSLVSGPIIFSGPVQPVRMACTPVPTLEVFNQADGKTQFIVTQTTSAALPVAVPLTAAP